MQQQLQKKNEFGKGKASYPGRELSEPIKAVLWIRNYFFRIRILLFSCHIKETIAVDSVGRNLPKGLSEDGRVTELAKMSAFHFLITLVCCYHLRQDLLDRQTLKDAVILSWTEQTELWQQRGSL
jgi:hypothetical protein